MSVSWYPKLEATQSVSVGGDDSVTLQEGKLRDDHIALLDLDTITFELQRYKYERAWHNVSVSKEAVGSLLKRTDWYVLQIPHSELRFTSFAQVRLWQEIGTALLKKYVERFYTYHKAKWEADFIEMQTLAADSGNFVQHYKVTINAEEAALLQGIEALKEKLERGEASEFFFGDFSAYTHEGHLYQPLIASWAKGISISPVALNKGEKAFTDDLARYLARTDTPLKDKTVYLLRNQSRGRGLGFFAEENFYPDFILWILAGDQQYVTFVDPKGLRNLRGLDDPKIRFAQKLKKYEGELGDSQLSLNSFIVSDTPLAQVNWWDKKIDEKGFLEHHVLFQNNPLYIERLIDRITM